LVITLKEVGLNFSVEIGEVTLLRGSVVALESSERPGGWPLPWLLRWHSIIRLTVLGRSEGIYRSKGYRECIRGARRRWHHVMGQR